LKQILISAFTIFLFLGCSTKNEYNGTYSFKKVKDNYVKEDILTAKKINADPFVLTIENASVTLYGYQTGQPIRKRFYTACILDNSLQLINKGFFEENYCIEHDKGTLVLNLVKDKEKKGSLICSNCEKYGFPGYWIKQ